MQDRLGILPLLWLGARAAFDPEEVQRQALSAYVPSTLFHTLHAGLGEARLAPEYGDPGLPRPPSSYLDEALAQGDWPMAPPPGADPPEVVFCICGNVLRHSSMGERVRDTLFAQAHIVLPAAAWYEKMGLKYLVGMVPYIHLADRAVAPLGEAKPEWEIYSLLARSLAAEAKRRGVREVKSFRGEPREIARLDERFGDGGRFPPEADEDVLRFILDTSSPSDGITLEDLRREGGAIRVRSLGPESPTSNFFTEYHLDEPVTPFRDFTEKKRPYPTLTGRQQFYVDHPWFLELSEELPTYKEPPAAGGDHPLVMTSGHTRWSIHSMWRDQALLGPRVERRRELRGAGHSDGRHPSRTGAHVRRLGALPVPHGHQSPHAGSQPHQALAARPGLRPAALELLLLRAERGRPRHTRERAESLARNSHRVPTATQLAGLG